MVLILSLLYISFVVEPKIQSYKLNQLHDGGDCTV